MTLEPRTVTLQEETNPKLVVMTFSSTSVIMNALRAEQIATPTDESRNEEYQEGLKDGHRAECCRWQIGGPQRRFLLSDARGA